MGVAAAPKLLGEQLKKPELFPQELPEAKQALQIIMQATEALECAETLGKSREEMLDAAIQEIAPLWDARFRARARFFLYGYEQEQPAEGKLTEFAVNCMERLFRDYPGLCSKHQNAMDAQAEKVRRDISKETLADLLMLGVDFECADGCQVEW